MKTLKFSILILILIAFAGCGGNQLAPGGAYSGITITTNSTGVVATNVVAAPDLQFYQADSAFLAAYSTVDTIFQYEYNNREALFKLSPAIKHTLDGIRPQAKDALLRWAKARQAYQQAPTPANLGTFQTVVAKMSQILSAAQAALPKSALPSSMLPERFYRSHGTTNYLIYWSVQ